SNSADLQIVQIVVDSDSLTMAPGGYVETGPNWEYLRFTGGSGNFPLWESEVLRPVFRALFQDWQNGPKQFPDLGDVTSPDRNVAGTPSPTAGIPSLTTPFDSLAEAVHPPGLVLIAAGEVTFDSDIVISSITGDNVAGDDSITIQAGAHVVRITGNV